MKYSSAMWAAKPSSDVHLRRSAFAGFVLCTLISSTDAVAGDQPLALYSTAIPDMMGLQSTSPFAARAGLSSPSSFSMPSADESRSFSATDFRPHPHSLFNAEPVAAANSAYDLPMIRGTVWQRLSEYKSHDRVRLLTLWESRGSSVSLQAGKRGDPSLQWSTRLMNRGGATRGLLDQFVSVSLGGFGTNSHSGARAPNSAAAAKPLAVAAAGPK